MASPNFAQYIDLTINNKTTETVYNDAVEYAQIALPEFSPRVGTIENALLEAMSHSTASLIAMINALPDGLMEGLLNLMGFTRIEATASTATVEIELSINTGATISSGTIFSYDVYDSNNVLTQYLYETKNDVRIDQGDTTGTVEVIAVDPSVYPDIPVPSNLTVVSSTPYILSVTMNVLKSVGTDTETDAEYFNRAVTYLGSLSSAITTASQLTNYIAVNYPTVSRYKVYDLTQAKENDIVNAVLTSNVVTLTSRYAHNFSIGDSVIVSGMANAVYNGTYTVTAVPTTTTFRYAKTNGNIATAATTVGAVILASGMLFATSNVGGAVTISLCDSTGAAISLATKDGIRTEVGKRVVAGLNVYMHDMNTFNVDVACTVVVESNYDTASVGTAVSEAIESYLSISGWDFSPSINHLYLTTIASKVVGVKYVSSLDVSVNGSTTFASDNGLSVTILEKGVIPIGDCTTIATV
ncbi:Baseplate protein J-like [uncultured Caudovirales phage]|uniref:Baseplate protein J-like n=1 Tax=uncultured Caudovirales phage TaxID=2100421 RepID=A0A6J5PS68_9CAUD|nr:Baseplate protein J-like [uncultured Caudovirales phage]CAB4155520.1 Baseplate protein J-like [uncultured Caudovirales phage]CAB4160196.1 Baseplate protein J-like [uncultured Caudovirales phage]CAB4164593.1 Baseplate protein J-like [uncultured Caudovirales phage]CAB4172171.1 Baseplate protein J-like [uncultured Caudovirales phage]